MEVVSLLCLPAVCGDVPKQIEGYNARDLEGVSIGVGVGYGNSNMENWY